MSEFLPGVIGDAKRRRGEGKIRPLRDQIVYVEGWSDAKILQEISEPGRHKFVKPNSKGKLYNGKKGVIRMAKLDPETASAIVDMDYDFAGNQISDASNVNDTRMKCCLLAYLLGDEEFLDLMKGISRNIYPKETKKRKGLMKSIIENIDQLYQIAQIRTWARLYRGWKFRKKPREAPRKKELPNYSQLSTKKGVVQDLIPSKFELDFATYCDKNRTDLQNVGLNDHSLEEVLVQFISRRDPQMTQEYTARCIQKTYERYLVQNKSSEDISQLLP
jgi:hypothetical protein